MRHSNLFALLIIILSFAVGAYWYPELPDNIASHWNARGEVDGYMSKSWGLFLTPLISLGVYLLLMVIPKIDPLKKNFGQFRKEFDTFVVVILMFLFYIHLLTILWNVGFRFNMIQLLSPAFATLFYFSGVLIERAKRNWFVGIRTPWTLSSDEVWDRTHRLGGRLFKALSVVSLGGVLLPNLGIFFVIFPVSFSAIYVTMYSYFEYKKLNR